MNTAAQFYSLLAFLLCILGLVLRIGLLSLQNKLDLKSLKTLFKRTSNKED
jgi:hypothetical protein